MMPDPSLAAKAQKCAHCGDACADDAVVRDQLLFCCQGCSTVHQMLAQHNLSDFYKMAEGTGIKGQAVGTTFAFLDDEEIKQQLLLFADGKQAKTRFYLPQIHCASCLWLLERLPWLHSGILEAKVNYLRKEVFLTFSEEKITLRQLAELLGTLGYPPYISLDDDDETAKKPTASKSFYYQLGITGFCVGNIMLMSFPEYLGLDAADETYRNVFGYMNMLLSVPVFLYGAKSYWQSAYHALKNKGLNMDVPIALGILALFLRSSYEVITHTGAGFFDSLAMLVFLLLVGKWFQQRTFSHISFERDYRSYFPIAVTKLVDGQEVPTPLSKLQKGDVVQVRNGELIPADAWLRQGDGRIDYSFITGEALPVEKQAGEFIYAGGRQQGAMLTLELAKPVSQSYLTQLWNADAFQKTNGHKGLETISDRTGRNFTFTVLVLSAISGAYWWGISPAKAVQVVTAVLIVACPCALALAVPFALGNMLRLMAREGLFVKDTSVIERMSRISHIVFDKTGTIATAGEIRFEGEALTAHEQAQIKTLCNQSVHPLSQEIGASLHPDWQGCEQASDFKETSGQGIEGWVGEHYWRLGKASFVGSNAVEENFRTRVYVAKGASEATLQPIGFFEMRQALRPGVDGLLQRLGMRLSMLSGDQEGERERMKEIFGKEAELRFRQSPSDKMAYIAQLQQNGEHVMMLGDGLNDAGALQQSNVGIAVSEQVHQFSPACDAILQGQQLASLDRLLRMSKMGVMIVKRGFLLSLTYNVIGVTIAMRGELQPVIAAVLMPLSSFTVVSFCLLATAWMAKRA